ncbi:MULTISPECIES: hypothetical protein [Burkholderia]|uniref:Uncharacterized protein n=1 Tax=Burkholderia contaminans TaxID=488447 RepID=A0A6P3ASJ3_9BURK|nr:MULTISPECIES: hypothetical protein [Burkholderia]MDN7491647.1 hypothetical protein [Burkholderia sp. AU45274]VWD50382.1 hypothetical protein BCO71171_05327 [Burkholderia contaminans]
MTSDSETKPDQAPGLDGWCTFDDPSRECDIHHARIPAELEIAIHPEHR